MISLESLDKVPMHIHHSDDWTHSHGDIVVHQQPISHHCSSTSVTDEIRFAIIAAVNQRPGIWDSQREKTSGASRKELFAEVTREVNLQHGIEPPIQAEEVEKQWKNLKDTFIKTRKKLSYSSDGSPVQPKWKFYMALTFLDSLNRGGKRRYEEEDMLQPHMIQMKRMRDDEDGDDEYMAFSRSLAFQLKEIGFKDRTQWLKLMKSITDLVYETHMNVILNGPIR